MSDLASPLLVTMGDEAHAYICLCALMTRLYPNFLLDGEAMTLKFSHLTESLQVYDPDFYYYLKSQQADDLLFCYRWLLLEMKREFAFDDALRMLEVLWASLPQKSPVVELSLKEKEFDPTIDIDDDPPPLSPLIKAPRENAYTKVCAIRRQSSSFSLANVKAPKLATCKQMNHSLDENATRKIDTHCSLKHAKEFQSLDDAALQQRKLKTERLDILLDKKEFNTAIKDSKLHLRRSMKSVPEDSKHLDTQEASMWSSTGNLTNGNTHTEAKDAPLGNQIRMLRNKISVHNNKFFSSLDKLDGSAEPDSNRPKVKMIKNLNEFLNFATGSKPGTEREKLQRTHSVIERTSTECPRITLTKTSFDENDLRAQDSKEHKINKTSKGVSVDTTEGSSPDDSQEYYPMTTSMTRELRLELEHLDRQVFGQSYVNRCSMICDSTSDSSTEEKPTQDCTEIKQDCNTITLDTQTEPTVLVENIKRSPLLDAIKPNARSAEDIYLWENPLHRNTPTTRTTASCPQTPDEQADLDFDGDTGEIFEEHSGKKSITPIRLLRKNQSLEPQDLYRDSKHSSAHSSESDSSEREPTTPTTLRPIKINQADASSTSRSHNFFSSMSQELENAKRNCESLLTAKQSNLHSVASTINNFQKKYEVFKPPTQRSVNVSSVGNSDNSIKSSVSSLPPPNVFGGGNSFLMFLCLTVLLQHRDYIMRNRMDYNELAMHFDKMVRKHNVNRVLNQARQMYAIYLKQQALKTGDITT